MASASLVKANECAKTGDFDGALKLLESLAEPEKSGVSAQNILGVALWKVGRLDEAAKVLGKLEGPATQNHNAVRLDMKVRDLKELTAKRNTANYDPASLAAEFFAIDLEEPCTGDVRFHALYNAGLCHLDAADWSAASQCLEAAIEIKPTAFAWHNLGEAFRQLGDLNSAAEAFAKALEMDDSDDVTATAALRGLVEAKLQASMYQSVLDQVDQLMTTTMKSDDFEPYYWRGMARLHTGDSFGAADDLAKVSRASAALDADARPTSVKSSLFRANTQCGEKLLIVENKPAEAAPYFEAALAAWPGHAEADTAKLNHAICLAKSGRSSEAVHELEGLLKGSTPVSVKAQAALGSILLEKPDYAGALLNFAAVLAQRESIQPSSGSMTQATFADTAHNAGFCSYKLGDYLKARDYFILALELHNMQSQKQANSGQALELVECILKAMAEIQAALMESLDMEYMVPGVDFVDNPNLQLDRLPEEELNAAKLGRSSLGAGGAVNVVVKRFDERLAEALAKCEAAIAAASSLNSQCPETEAIKEKFHAAVEAAREAVRALMDAGASSTEVSAEVERALENVNLAAIVAAKEIADAKRHQASLASTDAQGDPALKALGAMKAWEDAMSTADELEIAAARDLAKRVRLLEAEAQYRVTEVEYLATQIMVSTEQQLDAARLEEERKLEDLRRRSREEAAEACLKDLERLELAALARQTEAAYKQLDRALVAAKRAGVAIADEKCCTQEEAYASLEAARKALKEAVEGDSNVAASAAVRTALSKAELLASRLLSRASAKEEERAIYYLEAELHDVSSDYQAHEAKKWKVDFEEEPECAALKAKYDAAQLLAERAIASLAAGDGAMTPEEEARAAITWARLCERDLEESVVLAVKAARRRRVEKARLAGQVKIENLQEVEREVQAKAKTLDEALERKHLSRVSAGCGGATSTLEALIWSSSTQQLYEEEAHYDATNEVTVTVPTLKRLPLPGPDLFPADPESSADARELYGAGWSVSAIKLLMNRNRNNGRNRLRMLARGRAVFNSDDSDALALYSRGWAPSAIAQLLRYQGAASLNALAEEHASELGPNSKQLSYDYSKLFSYDALSGNLKKLPEGVDPSHRELHLFDGDFLQHFKCSKDEFAAKPAWKQAAQKKKICLF